MEQEIRWAAAADLSSAVDGPGPDGVNWNALIDDWVEKGTAPARIVATKEVAGKVTRSRRLCAYPSRAIYNGSGSVDDEKNFRCGIQELLEPFPY